LKIKYALQAGKVKYWQGQIITTTGLRR